MTRSDEMSHRFGSASRVRKMGLANASPTIDMELIWYFSMVSRSSVGSNFRPGMVTMHPATIKLLMALNKPVPCMSGAAGKLRGPGLVDRSPIGSPSGTGGSRFLLVLSSVKNKSSWRHMTPFGIPVVPPV